MGGVRDDEGANDAKPRQSPEFPGPGAPGHCMEFLPALQHQPLGRAQGLGGLGLRGQGSCILSDADARPCEVPTVPVREAVGTMPAWDGDVTEESQPLES